MPVIPLCMELKGRIDQYKAEHGRIPKIIMLKNHGIFVSGDTAEEIRSLVCKRDGSPSGGV